MGVGLQMIGGKTASTAAMRDTSAMETLDSPEVGAIRYTRRKGGGHVGLVIEVHDTYVVTIEGNTTGGRVASRTHAIGSGDGEMFRMPNYSGYPVEDVMEVAKAQLDYQEGPGGTTPFGAFTGANGKAWCASFLSWCFDRAYPGGGELAQYGTGDYTQLSEWSTGEYGSITDPAYLAKHDDSVFEGQIWGNSELAVYLCRLSNGSYFTRANRADHVTVHNAFEECSIEQLAVMAESSGKGYNYGVAADGTIGLFVDEQLWTNSCDNWQADSFGINIICSGSSGGFSEGAIPALTDLMEDIYRRNHIYLVTFNENIDDTLTLHRYYNSGVDCPGSAAEGQLREVATEVNQRLSAKIQTNFVQVGARLADSLLNSLRTQSLINVRQLRPYIIKIAKTVSLSEIDVTGLYLAGVVGAFIDIGIYNEETKYDSANIYKWTEALSNSLPVGLVMHSKASSVKELRTEAYWLRFIISKAKPKLGIWLTPSFTGGDAAELVDEWYEFFVDWGLKSKCGLYCNLSQASDIGWPRQANYMPLWLSGVVSSVCPDDELLTPTFFKLNDLTNYGISVDGSYGGSIERGGSGGSSEGSSSGQSAQYTGELKVVQGPDGTTTVVVPQVTDHAVAKKWESYTAITNKNTINYKLTHSDKTITDELGFRKYDGRYLIAVGSGVCAQTGTYIDVKLADGTTIPCIMGDGKADIHTDKQNIYTNVNSTYCCSEFIMDRKAKSWSGGDCSKVNGWNSPVVGFKVYNKRVVSP